MEVDPTAGIPLSGLPDRCRKIQPSIIRECRKIQISPKGGPEFEPPFGVSLFRPPDGCRKIQPSVIRECRKIQYPEVFALDLGSSEQYLTKCQFLAEPTNS